MLDENQIFDFEAHNILPLSTQLHLLYIYIYIEHEKFNEVVYEHDRYATL